MVGLAREVAALFDGELLAARRRRPGDRAPRVRRRHGRRLRRAARATSAASSATSRSAPSPLWLRARLHAAGMRSISNVVDVTNYVMHVYGSPLHAFDRAKLAGGRIVVRRAARRRGAAHARRHAAEARRARPADHRRRRRPVALAAIMGGQESEVADETTEVLLEAANFEPIGILRTSERLGLRTEGSNRWEKGVDPYLGRARGGAREPAARRSRRRRADRAAPTCTPACPRAPSSGFGRSARIGSSASRSRPHEQRGILERLGFDVDRRLGRDASRPGARAT